MHAPPDASLPDLAARVAALALERRTTLATAESCTGGMVAALLTEVAGVSAVFLGGVIAYANAAKRDLLGVPDEMLLAHGAVSGHVAVAMARGARGRLQADLAVATTGIAGPGGGTEQKPVGLTYIALASARGEQCRRFRFEGDRAENRVAAAREALVLILEALSTDTG
jgi:PncC family amidohydrolase